jgi:hypothetical protein
MQIKIERLTGALKLVFLEDFPGVCKSRSSKNDLDVPNHLEIKKEKGH